MPDSTNPQSWNMYGYALNSPLVYMDPSGLGTQYGTIYQSGGCYYQDVTSGEGNSASTLTIGFGCASSSSPGFSTSSNPKPPKVTNPPQTKNPGQPNKQLNCLIEATKDRGPSIVLDAVGTIPIAGNAVATTGRLARAAIAVNHVITKPVVSISSGSYSAYGAITAGPENPVDNFVGSASAGTGVGLTLADMSLGGTETIPVAGNIVSGATLLWDGFQGYKTYQACMAKPD